MNQWPPLPITEADLHAYVDDVLAPARRTEIEAYLALRPAEAERLDAYAGQKRQLRSVFDPLLAEAAPAAILGPVQVTPAAPAATRARAGSAWWRLAAGLVLVLAGGMAGWTLHGAGPTAGAGTLLADTDGIGLAHRAAVAHAVYTPEQRHPVEIGAAQEGQLVTWLSKRLGTPLHAPALGGLGFTLMGGRLLPGDSGPVAQFMYEGGAGQRLTLYVSRQPAGAAGRGAGENAFRFAREGSVNVFYWIDGRFGYALSGGIDKTTLGNVAAAVYQQLVPAAAH